MSYEDLSAYPAGAFDAPPDLLAPTGSAAPPAKIADLRSLGWIVESRGCYWLARHGHRRIQLFEDGRVIFKDPTIRARYQLDDEWLKVIRFVWPNVQF
jgi:hypothetical protein